MNQTSLKSGGVQDGGRQGVASRLVASPSIDLPKGGGALKGIDEKFQANPVTGSASISIPLPLSPSRGGVAPEIDLSYDSGAGNGLFGLGWTLSVPQINRKTDKGLPRYIDREESDVFVMSGAEDLVPAAGAEGEREEDGYLIRVYRPRVESGFSRIERWRDNSTGIMHWRTISADNTTRIYGESDNARIADPANARRIFRWLLEFSHDGKGNAVWYKYKSEDDSGAAGFLSEENRLNGNAVCANRYLKSVSYGNKNHFDGTARPTEYHFELVLDYGEHDADNPALDDNHKWHYRPDPYSDYRGGFEIRTRRRCARMLMFHRFAELGAAPILVRSVDFEYTCNDSDISQLAKAQQKGYIRTDDGYESKALSAMRFRYQTHDWNDRIREVDTHSLTGLPAGLASDGSHILDLYGEGLSGVLSEVGRGWYYKRNLGGGRFSPPAALRSRPSTGSAAGIQELEGDSEKFLVDYDGAAPGFYRFEDGRVWTGHQAMRSLPNIDFSGKHVRTLDLDGDGRADLLVDDDRVFTYYRSEGKKGFVLECQRSKCLDEEKGPRIIFADIEQTIFLADMSGDGLTDIVRVRNGNVCYWPNMGHGRFGAKVSMSNSPTMDRRDVFSATRVRLADVDGTGAADLIYISHDKATVWLNKSGNGFTTEKRAFRLRYDNTTQLSVHDFLGQGTACIVWSSPLPTPTGHGSMRYIDLMGGKKPYLMTGYDNGMGRTVNLEYTPSTKYYLADREAGKPWVTKLPFPVHCLSKVVSNDQVSGHRFVNSYTYHHGYYDIAEREFRGFGRVDQVDSETFEHYSGASNAESELLHQDPVLTKTWYHLGAWIKNAGILEHYESEYHPVFKNESKLEQPQLNAAWTADERREAMRAFKGMPLRQEVYALDATELKDVPYTTSQMSYAISQLQPKGQRRHASYHVTQSESLTYRYERDTADPRAAHTLVLKSDGYGRPELAAEVVYGREALVNNAIINTEQRKNHIIVTDTQYAADVKTATAFRMGMERNVKTWELTCPGMPNDNICTIAGLTEKIASAIEIPFEAEPDTGQAQKRLVEHLETIFYNEELSGPQPPGAMSSHGLAYEGYTLSYTPDLLAYLYGAGRVDNNMLAEGGFLRREDGNWWARTGREIYSADAAQNGFFLPSSVESAFGAVTGVAYDNYKLLITSVTDPLGNVVSAENSYRTLSPMTQTDPNGNRTAVETDALGIVVKTAVMGKESAGEGDTLSGPTAKMEYGFAAFETDGKLIKPSWVRTSSRETHADPATRWLEQVEYSDGSGRVALVKAQAEPDANGNARWVGTGRTVLNNKGNPVKQYEPYFSNNDGWESEPEIVETGVTPIMYYDPLSRLIHTAFPNGTDSKVEFTAWEQKDYDQNDSVLDSLWYEERGSPRPEDVEPSDPESRAAWLAAKHADTPAVTHLDSLGRAFYVETSDGMGGNPSVTRTVLDIEGNEKEIIDARGNSVMTYKYGIHGEKAYTKSMDAGERWMLLAADGQPIYTWDSRGHRVHTELDGLRRPVKQKLSTDNGVTETVVGMTVYGEDAGNPAENNLRGQPWKIYDQSGVIENIKFDFKGNLLESARQLTQEYKQTVDWNANPALEDETFTTVTAYDALNRATNILTPHNSAIPASEIMPGYNEAGLLEKVDVKLRGAETVTAFVEDIDYDAKGQRESVKYGNGATTKYTYDEKTFRLRRLWTFRNGGTESLQDLNYTYDPAGNITEIVDNAQQTIFFNGQAVNPSQKFEYDALYRLKKATGREHSQSGAGTEPEDGGYPHVQTPIPSDAAALRNYTRRWKYDPVGNIMSLIHEAQNGNWNRAYSYDDNNNRLLSTTVGSDTVNYTYNEHGSMTAMPHLQGMEWDFAERLAHITRGTTEAYYNYDGAGERVRKVVEKNNGGIIETRLYLGGFEVFRKKAGNVVEVERETLHIMDDVKRIALVETLTTGEGSQTPAVRYQFDNHLGSASLELDETASIISYEEYYPYGDTSYQAGRNASEVKQKRYRYIDKEKDDENGLYYISARYYASWLGRWTAVDPAGLVDGGNLYAYVRGNPIKLIDTDGTSGELPFPNLIEFMPGNMAIQKLRDYWDYAINRFRKNPSREVRGNITIEHIFDIEAYDALTAIEYNAENYNSYLEKYSEVFSGIVNVESINAALTKNNYGSADEAARAGFDNLVGISSVTGFEHSAAIIKVGDRYHLRNFRVGTENVVLVNGITPEVDGEFGNNLTEENNLVGYIHTHVGPGLESFSGADLVQLYINKKAVYLVHTNNPDRMKVAEWVSNRSDINDIVNAFFPNKVMENFTQEIEVQLRNLLDDPDLIHIRTEPMKTNLD